MTTIGEVQKRWFMSLAPLYLIASNYIMQVALTVESPNLLSKWITIPIFYVLSGLTMVGSVWLVVASFLPHQCKRLRDATYEVCATLSVVLAPLTAVVFIMGWLGAGSELLKQKVNPVYVTSYAILGLLVCLALIAFGMWNASKRTPDNDKKKPPVA